MSVRGRPRADRTLLQRVIGGALLAVLVGGCGNEPAAPATAPAEPAAPAAVAPATPPTSGQAERQRFDWDDPCPRVVPPNHELFDPSYGPQHGTAAVREFVRREASRLVDEANGVRQDAAMGRSTVGCRRARFHAELGRLEVYHQRHMLSEQIPYDGALYLSLRRCGASDPSACFEALDRRP